MTAILAPFQEEPPEERCSSGFANSSDNFGLVMTGGLVEEATTVIDSPPLGVRGTVHNTAEAREANGSGAHGTGLEGHIEIEASKTLRPQLTGGGTDDKNFSMGRGIGELNHAITGDGYRLTGDEVHQNRTHRHFSTPSSGLSLGQCLLHVGGRFHPREAARTRAEWQGTAP